MVQCSLGFHVSSMENFMGTACHAYLVCNAITFFRVNISCTSLAIFCFSLGFCFSGMRVTLLSPSLAIAGFLASHKVGPPPYLPPCDIASGSLRRRSNVDALKRSTSTGVLTLLFTFVNRADPRRSNTAENLPGRECSHNFVLIQDRRRHTRRHFRSVRR